MGLIVCGPSGFLHQCSLMYSLGMRFIRVNANLGETLRQCGWHCSATGLVLSPIPATFEWRRKYGSYAMAQETGCAEPLLMMWSKMFRRLGGSRVASAIHGYVSGAANAGLFVCGSCANRASTCHFSAMCPAVFFPLKEVSSSGCTSSIGEAKWLE